jgi:hypothetical protein
MSGPGVFGWCEGGKDVEEVHLTIVCRRHGRGKEIVFFDMWALADSMVERKLISWAGGGTVYLDLERVCVAAVISNP